MRINIYDFQVIHICSVVWDWWGIVRKMHWAAIVHRGFVSVARACLFASAFALAFLFTPHTAFAADPFLHWDDGAGTDVTIIDGGTYAVPLSVDGNAYVHVDGSFFGAEGVLFYIPGPSNPTREFVDDITGIEQFPYTLAWPQAGEYELDIYTAPPPILIEAPWWRRMFSWVFGEEVYAQNPDDFLETIHFTIEDANAVPTGPDPVIIIPGILGSRIQHGVWTLDPVLHVYDNLIETLVGNGYVYGQDLFAFPYDWTQSNEITAEELKEKIDEVKAQTGESKVDLVAHSMGGLVARQYIQSPGYENDIDQLIFLGTPQLGAPLAYLMYEGGESDRTTEGFFFNLYLSHLAHEAGFDNTFDYLHIGHVVSVRELLPVYNYLFDGSGDLLDYSNGYPVNPFLEDLTLTNDQLALSGVEITNVIGNDGEGDTLNSFNVEPSTELPLWLHGVPTSLNRGEGDQTVPLVSAAPGFISSSTTITSDHTSLPTNAEGLVYSTLTGKTPTFLADVPLVERFLVLRVFSPIDIQITAPSGARMGKDFDTGQEFDEIPGAFYSGFDTNVEYVVIPNPEDGQYVITAQGTGSGGMYTLSTTYINKTQSVETNISSTVESGATTQAIATLEAASDDPIVVEQSLSDLITNLKNVIQNLDISDKQKTRLLKRLANIEKKIEKQAKRQSNVLSRIDKQIQKKTDGGKIDTNATAEISDLLDELVAGSTTVPFDEKALEKLRNQINALDAKPKLKNSLLNKINRLENLAALNRSLANMIATIERKEAKGKLSEADAESVLYILQEIQGAL